jgi:GNAT superfamily N-acetyltransferase
MTVHIRPATNFDASGMAVLLNEIIKIGGTTAYTETIPSTYIKQRLATDPDASAWHVATNDSEECLGFQWIAPNSYLPPEACDIATFVKAGQTGLGIGSRLFEATRAAAESMGYDWINANIRADNESGLTYYQSRGFRVYDHQRGIRLQNGQIVDKVLKRYDLKD